MKIWNYLKGIMSKKVDTEDTIEDMFDVDIGDDSIDDELNKKSFEIGGVTINLLDVHPGQETLEYKISFNASIKVPSTNVINIYTDGLSLKSENDSAALLSRNGSSVVMRQAMLVMLFAAYKSASTLDESSIFINDDVPSQNIFSVDPHKLN